MTIAPPLFTRRLAWLEAHAGQIVALLCVLVLLAGALYARQLGDQLRFLPDEQDYVTLADELAAHGRYTLDGSTPSAYRAPGYPWLLAGLHSLGGGLYVYRLANFVFLALAIWGMYWGLRGAGLWLAGLLAAILLAAYPVLFFTAGTLYPQTLALALLVWLINLLVMLPADREPTWRRVIGAGLLVGYLILSVPTFAFLAPLLALWLVWLQRPDWAAGLRRALVFGLLAAGMVGLWTWRNYQAFGSFVFVSANSGENLLVGNSEHTTPNGGRTIDISRYEAVGLQLPEVERDRYYRQSALAYMRAHPGQTLARFGLKFLNYFNYRNELVSQVSALSLKDLGMLMTYGPLLGVFLLRLGSYPWHRPRAAEALLAAAYLASGLVSALFFTRIRFRLPYDALLILVVGLALSGWARAGLARVSR